MRNVNKYIIALTVILAFGFAIAACQKVDVKENSTVAATDPFFTSKEKVVYLPSDDVSLSEVTNIRVNGDVVLITVQMMYQADEEALKDPNYDMTELMGEQTFVCSLSNSTVTSLDTAAVSEEGKAMCQSIAIRPDALAEAMFIFFDEVKYEISTRWFIMNLSTGEVGEEVFYNTDSIFSTGIMSFEIDQAGNRYFCSPGALEVQDSDGRQILFMEDEGFSGQLLFFEGKIYAAKESESGDLSYYFVDTKTEKVDVLAEEMNFGQVISLDGNSYSAKADKLIADDSGDEVFSWFDTDANLSHYLQRCYYAVLSPDTIGAVGIVKKGDQTSVYCNFLSKAKENPHAGKEILYVGGIQLLSDMDLMAAVYEYNLFSDNIFVKVKNYEWDPIADQEKGTSKEQSLLNLQKQIFRDIEDNNIDVVMNMGRYLWFSDNGVLMDLSSTMADIVQDNAYYGNLISAFSEGDKLFQIPICVSISGLSLEDDVTFGEGMTWEEMATYLSTHEKVYHSLSQHQQQEWVSQLIENSVYESYGEDTQLSKINQETIKEILMFAKENGKYSDSWTEEAIVRSESRGSEDGIQTIYNFADVVNSSYYLGYPLSLVGLPSTNDSGLGIVPVLSVAVSAQCENPDAAVEFVKLLLSSNYQNLIAENDDGIPVRCDAVELQISNAFAMSESDPMFSYYYSMAPTQELADRYRDTIRAASQRNGYDYTTLTIIKEEAAAYFADNKNIDEVIAVIINRISTMQKENNSVA